MAIEIEGFEMAPAPTETLYEKENGQFDKGAKFGETVTFGSHEEKPSLGEGNKVSEVNFPKDAVDEWPAPKRIHTFYIVKYRSYEDPSIKVKIEQADKEIQRRNLAKFQITETLREKRVIRKFVHFVLISTPLFSYDSFYHDFGGEYMRYGH